MAHQSLYRKYRPSTFDDVVGQQHIERTLRNAVAEGTVAHAYLFTGPRGTGKTTTARLLAKALLCERGPSGEPDGTCSQCVEIAEGRHPDVREIDAASNTGVDAVREEIIGRVQFAPTRGRYKVYIIDEVHMLSPSAFNALLKTLEEPPTHVVFVMCTTHPHKVPDTIGSRCQRFDFHRIGLAEIADRLRYIAEAEGFKVDRGAFTLIARHAEGGMRDAITALEQLASFTGGEVTVDDVEGMFGEVDSAQLFEVSRLVARRDVAGAFRWIAATVETGTDLAELVRELTSHARDLYVVAMVGDVTGIVDRPADEIAELATQAAEFGGPDRISRMLDLLGELSSEMRWSSDPRLSLEIALTRMTRPHGEMTLEALAERIEALELGAPTPRAVVSANVPVVEAQEPPLPEELPERPEADTQVPVEETLVPSKGTDAEKPHVTGVRHSGPLDRATVRRNWQAVMAEVRKASVARSGTFTNVEVDVDADGLTLVLEFPSDQRHAMNRAEKPDNRELLKGALAMVFGAAPPFRFQLGRGAVRPAESTQPVSVVPSPTGAPPDADIAVDEGPIPEYYETATGLTEPTEAHTTQPSAGLRDVLDSLGVQIVAEHPHDPDGKEE